MLLNAVCAQRQLCRTALLTACPACVVLDHPAAGFAACHIQPSHARHTTSLGGARRASVEAGEQQEQQQQQQWWQRQHQQQWRQHCPLPSLQ
jgi:hypothetical protein